MGLGVSRTCGSGRISRRPKGEIFLVCWAASKSWRGLKSVRVESLGSPASLRAFSRIAGSSQGAASGRGVEVAGVEGVEAAGDLAGELDVGNLVGADGDEVRLVEQDVGGLEEGVAEEAVGGEVLFAELLLLILVGGDALEPAEGGEHAEEQEELGVGGDVGLLEDDAAAGVEAGGEEVEGDLDVVGLDVAGVGVVGGEGVVGRR